MGADDPDVKARIEFGGDVEKKKAGAVRMVCRVEGPIPALRAIGACSCLRGRKRIG